MLLYDSDNPLDIPAGVHAAGYDDETAGATWAAEGGFERFPSALHITLLGNPNSDVFDIETGGGTPAQVPAWGAQRRAKGRPVIVYVNRSNGPAVEAELRGAAFTIEEVLLWIATDDGVTQTVTHWPSGAPIFYRVWAVQYATPSTGSGGHYDLSIVNDLYSGEVQGVYEVLEPTDPAVIKINAIYAFISNPEFAKFNTGFDAVLAKIAALPASTDGALLQQIQAEIADLKAHPATILDPTLLTKVEAIEANLNAPKPPA